MPDYISHLDDPVYKMLVSARVRMLFKEPEIGNQLVSLDLFPDNALKVPLRRKGHVLIYNRDLVKTIDPKELCDLLRAATALSQPEPAVSSDHKPTDRTRDAAASQGKLGAGLLQLLEY